MTRVEQRLAELLSSAAPPSQGVSFDELAGRVRRRRAVRWSVVASIGTVAVVVVAASLAATSRTSSRLTTAPSVDLTGTIPWIDAPAPPYQAPTASPTPAPATDARPCSAADVTASFGFGDAAGGHLEHYVTFRNTSQSTCLLKGYPQVTATEPGQPDVTGTDGGFFLHDGTANMPPGHDTLLGVETDTLCPANPGGGPGGPLYHHLDIALPGGGTLALDQVPGGFDVTCGLHLTRFFVPQPEQPDPHDPLSDLQVSLEVPPAVSAGATLTYVTDLTNPTDQAISLERCPGYVEAGAGPPTPVKEVYALNCAPVSAIAPHATVRFEMRLHVPAQTPAGPFTFHWSLAGPDVTSDATVNVTAPTSPAEAVVPDPRKPLITGEHVEERMNCAAAAKLTTAPTVTLVLATDTPVPRCAYARLSQRLIVENRTGQTVLITIGSARIRTLDGRDAVVSLRDAVDAPGGFQVHVYPGHGPSLIIVR